METLFFLPLTIFFLPLFLSLYCFFLSLYFFFLSLCFFFLSLYFFFLSPFCIFLSLYFLVLSLSWSFVLSSACPFVRPWSVRQLVFPVLGSLSSALPVHLYAPGPPASPSVPPVGRPPAHAPGRHSRPSVMDTIGFVPCFCADRPPARAPGSPPLPPYCDGYDWFRSVCL